MHGLFPDEVLFLSPPPLGFFLFAFLLLLFFLPACCSFFLPGGQFISFSLPSTFLDFNFLKCSPISMSVCFLSFSGIFGFPLYVCLSEYYILALCFPYCSNVLLSMSIFKLLVSMENLLVYF